MTVPRPYLSWFTRSFRVKRSAGGSGAGLLKGLVGRYRRVTPREDFIIYPVCAYLGRPPGLPVRQVGEPARPAGLSRPCQHEPRQRGANGKRLPDVSPLGEPASTPSCRATNSTASCAARPGRAGTDRTGRRTSTAARTPTAYAMLRRDQILLGTDHGPVLNQIRKIRRGSIHSRRSFRPPRPRQQSQI